MQRSTIHLRTSFSITSRKNITFGGDQIKDDKSWDDFTAQGALGDDTVIGCNAVEKQRDDIPVGGLFDW